VALKSQSEDRPQKVTVHGPNGIAKTALAVTFPHSLIDAQEETTPLVLPPAPVGKLAKPINGQPEQNL
jgi:hypothetical protein